MQKKPITNKILWIFAVGQFGWSLLSGIISTWLVHLYTGVPENVGDTNGLFADFITQSPILASLTLFGLITAVGRLFDAVTDPLIASWSDRANFKGGRRIPFMKAIAIPFALVTVAVFVVPQFSSVAVNNTVIFILLMLFYLFMTIYCTPYNALIAELGDTQRNRINVSTYISFTYIAGFSLATLIPSLASALEGVAGSQANGMRLAIGIMAAVACIAMLIPAFLIKEREYIHSEPVRTPAFRSLIKTFKNAQFRRFVYADVIYFFAVTLFQTGLADFETKLMGIPSTNTFLLTVIMTVISLMLYPAVNKLAPKLGKKKIIITGFFLYATVFLLTALCGTGMGWGIAIAGAAGIPMAILGILPQACVADVSELNTLETGEDRSGMFFAARTFAMKLGQALSMLVYTSVTVATLTSDGTKYVAPSQYRTTAAIAAVTCLIGAILFFFYNEKKILNRIETLKQEKESAKLIREDKYQETMENTVLPGLDAVKTEGTFHSFDDAPIRWYSFASPKPERTVVILHGFTESARKYAEMIWYFIHSGANVYVIDQRGHGNSFRHVEDCTLVHVEHFEDYVKDLDCFVNEVVPKDLPLFLYAHSMGGAVAALYLEQHPGVFTRAILSSPMIAPDRSGYPLFVGKLICRLFIAMGKAKERIYLSTEYPGEEHFADSCSTSEARFAFYEAYRRATPTHQSYSATYRWTLESMKVTADILKKGAPEAISIPVLLCSAEMEQVVLNEAQNQFADRLPSCEHKTYHAKHEIFNSTDDVMETYVADVLNFLIGNPTSAQEK